VQFGEAIRWRNEWRAASRNSADDDRNRTARIQDPRARHTSTARIAVAPEQGVDGMIARGPAAVTGRHDESSLRFQLKITSDKRRSRK
jgi:hypothetical protein